MSSVRDRVLGDIRRSLGSGPAKPDDVRERIEQHPRHILPTIGEAPEQRFTDKLVSAGASVARVAGDAALAAEIERYLEAAGIDEPVVIGHPELAKRLDQAGVVRLANRPINNDDRVGVTPIFCAIAETGTLMLLSGEHYPTRLNFMPDYHLAIVPIGRLVNHMEVAWDLMRAEVDGMPRSVNFISGPSKTADIEQAVEYGAHGPRCLHVILVG